MTWMLTRDGAEYHLTGTRALINTYVRADVAHALAQINRFTGHARRPYSVAEHSLLCADLAAEAGLQPVVQLAALLHDAHEAYTGDTSTPAKQAIGPGWHGFEDFHAQAFRRHHGLLSTFTGARAALRRIDLIALATERRDLTRWDSTVHAPWPILDTPGSEIAPADTRLDTTKREQMHWTEWRSAFSLRWRELEQAAQERADEIVTRAA